MPTKSKYDHVVIVRGGNEHLFNGRAVGGANLLLLAGIPEPVENIDPEYVDALVNDGVVIRVTKEGNYHGASDRHASVIAAEKAAKASHTDIETVHSTALESAGGITADTVAVPVSEASAAPPPQTLGTSGSVRVSPVASALVTPASVVVEKKPEG